MTDNLQQKPRVFISYSWTSQEHIEWAGDLGERLMSDGIDVVLDQWSLEDGHDVNAFMETMVSDPSIKRVVIISDALYSAKADGRKDGVGKETQIISPEVYESQTQTKFVPVLRERDEEGKACLPIYLKSRKYIDFSDPNNEADAYDQLLRNIFERPHRPKPVLGKPPSHIFDDDATIVTSAQKAKRFRDIVVRGKGNPSAAFQDFADEFFVDFEQLRMTYSRDEADTWCERIRSNIERATAHRDVFVGAVYCSSAHLPSEQFLPLLLDVLERLLPFQERPDGVSCGYRCSEDNFKLLCYEMFLYTFAALVKAKQYSAARKLIDHRYVSPLTLGGSDLEGHGFTRFNSYAQSLEEICAKQNNRLSVMADLVHDRAKNKQLRFSDILQADVLLWLASKDHGWYPRCLVYAQSVRKLELFVRATNQEGFAPLQQLLNVRTPQDLLQLLNSNKVRETLAHPKFFRSACDMEFLNLQQLQQCWSK